MHNAKCLHGVPESSTCRQPEGRARASTCCADDPHALKLSWRSRPRATRSTRSCSSRAPSAAPLDFRRLIVAGGARHCIRCLRVHGAQEQLDPGKRVAGLQRLAVALAIWLEIRAQIQHRHGKRTVLDEDEHDQQPAEAGVAIEERVQRLELVVQQRVLMSNGSSTSSWAKRSQSASSAGTSSGGGSTKRAVSIVDVPPPTWFWVVRNSAGGDHGRGRPRGERRDREVDTRGRRCCTTPGSGAGSHLSRVKNLDSGHIEPGHIQPCDAQPRARHTPRTKPGHMQVDHRPERHTAPRPPRPSAPQPAPPSLNDAVHRRRHRAQPPRETAGRSPTTAAPAARASGRAPRRRARERRDPACAFATTPPNNIIDRSGMTSRLPAAGPATVGHRGRRNDLCCPPPAYARNRSAEIPTRLENGLSKTPLAFRRRWTSCQSS